MTTEVVLSELDITGPPEEYQFFTQVFKEARAAGFQGKRMNGPLHPEISGVLATAQAGLDAMDPPLTPEHLMPMNYVSPRVTKELGDLSRPQLQQLDKIKYSKANGLIDIGKQHQLAKAKVGGVEFQLDDPGFCYQSENGVMPDIANRGCMSACFRMVFQGITGNKADGRSVISAMIDTHGSHVVDDEEYLKAFATPTFKRAYPDAAASIISLTGADLSTIAAIAEKSRARIAGSKIFGIVGIESESVSGSTKIWHTNVLLGADGENVTVHDPAFKRFVANREITLESFYRRWATALTRAHLIIAKPA